MEHFRNVMSSVSHVHLGKSPQKAFEEGRQTLAIGEPYAYHIQMDQSSSWCEGVTLASTWLPVASRFAHDV